MSKEFVTSMEPVWQGDDESASGESNLETETPEVFESYGGRPYTLDDLGRMMVD